MKVYMNIIYILSFIFKTVIIHVAVGYSIAAVGCSYLASYMLKMLYNKKTERNRIT
jgi:hypothetical protein